MANAASALKKILSSKKANQIEALEAKYNLEDDSELFYCYNEDFVEDAQFPHLVTGEVAKQKLVDGYYRLEYAGPNPTPKVALIAEEAQSRAKEAQEAVKLALKELQERMPETGDVKPASQAVRVREPKSKTIIE